VADDGLVLAHGGNPKLVGKNMKDLRDANGKAFIAEMIEKSKTTGAGWVDYKWTNPTSKKAEDKTTYVHPLPAGHAFIGCGIYKK
jgi:signal transduction histidine kinase